ncbi:MAG TPA: carbohydrate kinase family protein [Kiritimatiellia bacterium]|nr:carbohydrate kinase family protein [Kiritimatiellia bacterium]HOM58886.1 carbohydrate kinase family protein [Kiritimatiellia bacterium]HOR98032.1 carbohydrate kinase family protein [Kiritimatiellia bacterium]HRU18862.1 carbohydrate kinase family protein [Kiritimatiellia bacterium]
MRTLKTIAAGHVCLDIIPTFLRGAPTLEAVMQPGKLVDMGPAVLSTGGSVANTGMALKRLGLPVRLMGKVGRDAFGAAVCDVFRTHDETLVKTMIVDPAVATSYTVVINPPGIDRIFLHCPGANDTFGADDVIPQLLDGMDIFHFGYPPLMRAFYTKTDELMRLFRKVKECGLTTSLDMALPDPQSPAGQADWRAILKQALPFTDIFSPSLDEIVFMLHRERGLKVREQAAEGVPMGGLIEEDVRALADELIALGVAVVMLKLGNQGAYLRVTSDETRLATCGCFDTASRTAWGGVEFFAPCFDAKVAGTTGSGDCTVAGLLAAIAKGLTPAESLRTAVAVGSASVEQPDATSGVPTWTALDARIRAGWGRETPKVAFQAKWV